LHSHKKGKAENLEERDWEDNFLPTETETDDPDGKRPTGVSERPSRSADVPSDAQGKEAEQ